MARILSLDECPISLRNHLVRSLRSLDEAVLLPQAERRAVSDERARAISRRVARDDSRRVAKLDTRARAAREDSAAVEACAASALGGGITAQVRGSPTRGDGRAAQHRAIWAVFHVHAALGEMTRAQATARHELEQRATQRGEDGGAEHRRTGRV